MYRNGQLDGDVVTYYLSGKLRSRVHYDQGVLNDPHWCEYYENGVLLNTAAVIHGKQEGVVKQFYPNGHVKIEGIYKKGRREGVFKTLRIEGWLWYKEFFIHDQLIKRLEYDAQGHLVMQQNFYK